MKKAIILVCVFLLLFSTTCFAQQMDARTMVANVNSYLKSHNSSSYCYYTESRFYGDFIIPCLHLSKADADIVSNDFASGNYRAHVPSVVLKYMMDFYYASSTSFTKMSTPIHKCNISKSGVKISFFVGDEFGIDTNIISISSGKLGSCKNIDVDLYEGIICDGTCSQLD